MELCKIQISKLDGKNWVQWRYRMTAMLNGIDGLMDVVEGKVLERPTADGTSTDSGNYSLGELKRKISTALLLITNNISDEILDKVMRFDHPKDVWDELHRLYDGLNEDRLYEACLAFFKAKKEVSDDMATYISKMKNLWHTLKQELVKSGEGTDLPEFLLICKILDSLPDTYFSFKSTWMLMSKKDRTVENLTSQLCVYEKALSNCQDGEFGGEVFATRTDKYKKIVKVPERDPETSRVENRRCFICKEKGHLKLHCPKRKSGNGSTKEKKGTDASMMLTSVFLVSAETDLENWYVDNGATSHVTMRADLFKKFKNFEETHSVSTANGSTIKAVGKGDIQFDTSVNGKPEQFHLRDVWYVPGIKRNLFSVLAAQDNNSTSVFESLTESCTMKIDGKVIVTGKRMRWGGLYKLNCKALKPMPSVNITEVQTDDLLQLYHERFGHQNKRHVSNVIERELGIKTTDSKELCDGCVFGKSHRVKFGTREKATKPGERFHTDVCGPFPESYSKFRYFLIIKDEFTRFRYLYLLRAKSEVYEKLKQMLAEVKTSGHQVQELLSDGGGEFDNEQVRKILAGFGTRQRLVVPYTPEQNGVSERENRTIVECVRSMMYAHEELPQKLWAELVLTAVYILNRTGPTTVEGKSPYELWFGKKPQIKHLRIIGTSCYAHIPKQKRKKLDKKAVKTRLIGYDEDDGYRLWVEGSSSILRSRDVTFNESPLEGQREDRSLASDQNIGEVPYEVWNQPSFSTVPSWGESDKDKENKIVYDGEVREDNGVTENQGCKVVPLNSDDDDVYNDAETSGIVEESIEFEGERMEMSEQMNAGEIGNIVLRDRTKLKQPNKFKDYILLMDMEQTNSEPENFKEAIQSWDCREWRRAKLGTVRAVLSIAASENMTLKQFEVSRDFLYGDFDEEVYMKQPEGFDDGTVRVCFLKRSLYGLKQAPRCWDKRIMNYFKEIGFKESEADSCLLTRNSKAGKLIVVLYVDDGLVASSNEKLANEFLEQLKRSFKITTKPASYFLGIEIENREDGLKIHQASYTKKVLKRFGMEQCKPVSTPITTDTSIQKEAGEDNVTKKRYREIVGALAYLMVGTRPDIAYAVSVVSRHLDSPTDDDCIKVKRIMRYLQYTLHFGIHYKRSCRELECFSDADHGGDIDTGCSTSGVLCMYAGGAVTWMSQRQQSVAISTTEAEIVAASEGAKESVWLARLIRGLTEGKGGPTLQVDNEAAIKLAENPQFHRRTKHIRIRHFFVRELVTNGEIKVKKVTTEDQLADIFTKALPRPRLQKIVRKLGVH